MFTLKVTEVCLLSASLNGNWAAIYFQCTMIYVGVPRPYFSLCIVGGNTKLPIELLEFLE